MNEKISVSVHVLHSDLRRTLKLTPGQTYADALTEIDYHPLGHRSWRVWVDKKEVPLSTVAQMDDSLIVSHVAAGDLATANDVIAA
jgi:hypothetical protein